MKCTPERIAEIQAAVAESGEIVTVGAKSGAALDALLQAIHHLLADREALTAEIERIKGEQKSIFAAIDDAYDVEDWTNPEKGITELEAHCNALGEEDVCRTKDHSPDVFNSGNSYD